MIMESYKRLTQTNNNKKYEFKKKSEIDNYDDINDKNYDKNKMMNMKMKI